MSQILAPFQLLELNVISAQDLAPIGRNMRTYAVSWVHPDRKLSTRVDTQGHTHPTWNDKFVFRVDDEFLYSDTSAIMIEIYALHWFKDIHVGTVRVLVGNLISPPTKPFNNNHAPLGMRFVALQVRRASGRPQGILNIGVAVLDSSMRSMPLYTHNASAVGYRHLMGEKDAYDSHNHLSPQLFNNNNPKPELRRTKSDTSSLIVTEAAVRRQRNIVNMGKANSDISCSEISAKSDGHSKKKNHKKKKKKKMTSSSSSVMSGVSVKSGKTSSILSDSVLPWKVKNGKSSTEPSNVLVEAPPLPPPEVEARYDDSVMVDNHDDGSSVNTVSESATYETNTDARQEQGHQHHLPVTATNVAYEVKASPKLQYRSSPAPAHFKNSPAPEQFRSSPAPEQFRNSPAPVHYRNSPAHAHYRNSPAPEQFRNSPAPAHVRSSPAREQFRNSPAPAHVRNSPVPEKFRNSPVPEKFRNSPAPEQFRNSPKPQFRNSPIPQQFVNSPKMQFANSPKPQFRNSPAVASQQFRHSPMVSKFNPAAGYGGSHRGTPLQAFGKVNGAFEYATPMRSNLGNIRPVLMTESELGPSPSEVAAAMARKPIMEEGNSTVGGWSLDESIEGLQSKLERWRTELPPVVDHGEFSSFPTTSTKTSRHTRRHTTDGGDSTTRTGGGNGLFSCFSTICGVECSIVCGGDPKGKKKGSSSSRRRSTPSTISSSL